MLEIEHPESQLLILHEIVWQSVPVYPVIHLSQINGDVHIPAQLFIHFGVQFIP